MILPILDFGFNLSAEFATKSKIENLKPQIQNLHEA